MKYSESFTGAFLVLLVFLFAELLGWAEDHGRDDIYAVHVTQALEVCANNGGLKRIEGELFTEHEFYCHNGAVFTYTPPKRK